MKKRIILQIILALLTCIALSGHLSSAKQKNFIVPRSGKTTEKADTPRLNAPSVTLYYFPDKYKNDIVYDKSHLREFAFRVKGTKKKVSCWRIEGEGADYFNVTKKGLVTVQWDIPYTEKCAEAVLKAVLKDGTVLEAGLKAYSEDNIYIDKLFGEFEETYIKHSMTEKEKVEKAAWYIGDISSYDAKESNWKSIFLKGKGDCVASRYALAYMCQHMGIKAQACNNLDYHGETLVQADGNFYIAVTGYDEPRPRHYMVYETDKAAIGKIIENNSILIKHFEF
ncbi:MAG: hypothetical protein HFH67_10515 [Lachnospiraceae bacterium]|nr:hypothetical protein [Lachnospiraceae bacterium]